MIERYNDAKKSILHKNLRFFLLVDPKPDRAKYVSRR